MEKIRLDITKALSFLDPGTLEAYAPQVAAAQTALEQGTCPGNDFLGWLHLPSSITPEFLNEVQAVADTLRSQCDYVVVAGIGGSYLGARAIIEALGNSFSWLVRDDRNPVILFAGNNIGEDYLYELTTYLKGKRFGVINISKSGTTTETALTFRLLKKQCEAERGKEAAKDVIVAITDAHKGAARAAADKEGYKTFVIPDNVGGRFSVLTPVGLLPIAVAGFDIRQLVAGAQDMEKATGLDVPYCDNIAAQYAAVRNALYQKAGKKIEIMANFQPKLHFVAEWWKQLYGESEGKDHKGPQNVVQSMQDVLDAIEEVNGMIGKSAENNEAQNQSMEQIRVGIEDISKGVEDNSASAEEASATSQELAAQAATLEELVKRFDLKDHGREE